MDANDEKEVPNPSPPLRRKTDDEKEAPNPSPPLRQTTGSRSRDAFVKEYIQTLPSPFVGGKVVKSMAKAGAKRLSLGQRSSSSDEGSSSEHPDVPEVLSEDEEWLSSRGQRRRFMVKLCRDLPRISEETRRKRLEFNTEQFSEVAAQETPDEKSDTTTSTPMIGIAGLCSASAISTTDLDESAVPESSTKGDVLLPPASGTKLSTSKLESADMFADSAMTYEDVQCQSQKLETAATDDMSCSKGTCNTGVVSISDGVTATKVLKRRFGHNKRGVAFRAKHYQAVDNDSPQNQVDEDQSADQVADAAKNVPSPIPVRQPHQAAQNCSFEGATIDIASDDNDSQANYSTCMLDLNNVQDLQLSQHDSSPPGTPANSSKCSSQRSLAPTPPFIEDDDDADRQAHVRGQDVITDDEAEKEWAINEEREEQGLAPIDFQSLKGKGVAPKPLTVKEVLNQTTASTTASKRSDSTDSNDDPMAEFILKRKTLARKEAKQKAKRLRKLDRQRQRREKRKETILPLKPEGPGMLLDQETDAGGDAGNQEATQMANVSFGSGGDSQQTTTNNEGRSRNKRGRNVSFKTTVTVRTQTNPTQRELSDSDFEADQPTYCLNSPPKKRGKRRNVKGTGKGKSSKACAPKQEAEESKAPLVIADKSRKRLRSPPPPPREKSPPPPPSGMSLRSSVRPVAKLVGKENDEIASEKEDLTNSGYEVAIDDEDSRDSICFSQRSIRNAETGEEDIDSSSEASSPFEDEWAIVAEDMVDAPADDDCYRNSADQAPKHLGEASVNPFHKMTGVPEGRVVYDDPHAAFAHFMTLRTEEEMWDFFVSQTYDNFSTRPMSFNYHKKKMKETLPDCVQLCVVDSKETGQREEFVCHNYPERDYPKEIWKEQLRETRSDLREIYEHWLYEHKPEMRERIEELRRQGKLAVDVFSDGVPPTRSGSRRMNNQLIRFVVKDDQEELLCECLHNACTIVYNSDFKLRSRDFCDGLAEVLEQGDFTPRLMIADMVERNALCNKQAQTAHYGCDQCIAESENLHWSCKSLGYPRRDEKSWEEEIPTEAGTDPVTYFGRKGPAPLKRLPGFKISEQVPVEPMHCLFLGITKHMIDNLLRSKKYHGENGGQEFIEKTVMQEYNKMRLPTEVQRMPRDFHQTWRSNEYKVFLLTMGHRVGELFHAHGMSDIGEAFSRFTFIVRAMLLNNAWYKAVQETYNIEAEVLLFYHKMEEIMGTSMMTANYHALSHLPFWRDKFRLHLLSAEPAETFYGRNKKNLEERNRHYGMQMHYKAAVNLQRGHYCRRNFSYKIGKKRHRIRDNAIIVNREMNVGRYTGEIIDGNLSCKRYYLTHYKSPSLDYNWSLVGLFELKGMVADRGNMDPNLYMKPRDICGKGIVTGNVLSIFTRDMWQV